MGLNIFGFQTEFKPHYSHQFKVQISNSDATDNNVVEYNVKSIKLPQFSINTEKRNYGNTSLGLPVFSFGDQYLEITFVETENFIVLETFLSKMSWTSSSPISKTYIIVEEYDETMSTLIRKHRYIGRVVEVGNPSWQRSGSAGYIELNVKFLVDSNKIEGATTNTFVGVAASNTVKQNNDLTGETLDEGRDYAAAQSEYASFENNVRNSIESAMASAQQAENQQRQAAQNQTQELDAKRQRQDDANRAIKAAEEAQKKQQKQQAAPAVPDATPETPSENQEQVVQEITEEMRQKQATSAPAASSNVKLNTKNGNWSKIWDESYEKEIFSKEGAKAWMYYDFNDTTGTNAVNLGSGSNFLARPKLASQALSKKDGKVHVKIDGKEMVFNSAASLDNAIKKAFGLTDAEWDQKLRAAGMATGKGEKGKGYATALAALGITAKQGYTIKDDTGKTSTVKFTNKNYLNIEMTGETQENVKHTNSVANETSYSKEFKKIVTSNTDKSNLVIQSLQHFGHAGNKRSGLVNKIFMKDEHSKEVLARQVAQGYWDREAITMLENGTKNASKSDRECIFAYLYTKGDLGKSGKVNDKNNMQAGWADVISRKKKVD